MLDLSTNTIEVTPKLAMEWLSSFNFMGQRAIRGYHARFLAELMRKKKYRWGSKIEFVKINNELRLVDGQHSLTAVGLCDIPQRMLVVVRPVQTQKELQEVYGTFGRELARTPADVIHGLGLSDQLDIRQHDLNKIHGALRLLLGHFQMPSHSRAISRDVTTVMDALLQDWIVPARLYLDAISLAQGFRKAPMRAAPVMAVALATLAPRGIQAKAIDFWEEVARDDGLRVGDPRKTLTDTLGPRMIQGDAATKARQVASAWNAHLEGRQLLGLSSMGKGKIGVEILGTHFKALAQRPNEDEGNHGGPSIPRSDTGPNSPIPLAAKGEDE